MRRREFIASFGAAAAAWPLAARAQDAPRARRIGMLIGIGKDDPDAQERYSAFMDELRQLGWTDGQNVQVEVRWASGDANFVRRYAAELIALNPDVIVSVGSLSAETLLRSSSTLPIVFTIVLDPVGAGLVKSLSRPGGNATGFMQFEYSLSTKWPGLLKLIAPALTRVAVLRDTSAAAIGQFAVIQSVAPSVGVEAISITLGGAADIERDIEDFARSGNGGLIATAGTGVIVHRSLINALAMQHKLPAIYTERSFVTAGGLVSYGPNYIDQYRRAAHYVDRILKGEKPGDLPVQAPTKYELVVNQKTAKAIGVTIPPSLLATADEVIE